MRPQHAVQMCLVTLPLRYEGHRCRRRGRKTDKSPLRVVNNTVLATQGYLTELDALHTITHCEPVCQHLPGRKLKSGGGRVCVPVCSTCVCIFVCVCVC